MNSIEPLNPQRLTPTVSLNRLRIAALPDGVRSNQDVIGKTAYELTSTAYLAAQVRAKAAHLKLESEIIQREDRELPKLLSASFDAPDPEVRAAANTIIRRFGHNIGCVLLTLKRGDPANRAARTDWDDSYWTHWASIRTIYCGGGLMNPLWWDEIHSTIGEVFAESGSDAPGIHRVSYGDSLPLVGGARRLPLDAEYALVFDFGGSFVKRAIASYADGALSELRRLPSILTQFMAEGQTPELFKFMASTIAQTFVEASADGLPLCHHIPVSLAAYVDANGQPYERQGGVYAALRTLSPNAQETLSASVAAHMKAPINVQLLHDGSAAASAYAGAQDTAVIMFGTALGVGFPPSDAGLRPIAASLEVRF
jgi:hypothetical protein